MKLLVVSHSCATPLNQQFYAEIAKVKGWHIDLVIPANWKNEYGNVLGAERWPAFNGRLLSVPVWKSGNIILHAYKASFAQLIRESNPDVIYVHHEPYAVATAQVYWANFRTKKCPIGFYSAQNIQKKYPPPFTWSEAVILRHSDFAFPVSQDVDHVFRGKGYAGPSRVLPLGIDTDTYHQRANHKALRTKLVGDREVLIGYVGRLVPEKGLTTLLAALGHLSKLSWKLVLIGAGPTENDLRKQAAVLGISDRIIFQGFVPHTETPDYLSAFDLLVLPSETQPNWREQFGRVILEALACGTPVLGSDSGEIPQLIQKTGGGLVFRERNIDDLAAKLRQLLTSSELRSTLAAKGATTIERQYSLAAVAQHFVETISSVRNSQPAN
jgi:glycosyltransferase involved in cell wall biosynthesis